MSLQSRSIECFVLRRSTNTNSFGLRGIWVIECQPSIEAQSGKKVHRVWSFVANYLDDKKYILGKRVGVQFWTDRHGTPVGAEHELSTHECSFEAKDVTEKIGLFSQALKNAWLGLPENDESESITARSVE